MSGPCVELSFPAKAEYLVLARLCLAGLANVARLEDDTLADLKLAVTEACTNAVRHAYGDDQDGAVRLRVEASDGRVVILVEDEGRGIERLPPEETVPAGLAESGMGLAVIEAVVDELSIGPGPGGVGTAVRMSKQVG